MKFLIKKIHPKFDTANCAQAKPPSEFILSRDLCGTRGAIDSKTNDDSRGHNVESEQEIAPREKINI